jgi:hypothetical protein
VESQNLIGGSDFRAAFFLWAKFFSDGVGPFLQGVLRKKVFFGWFFVVKLW